MELLIDTTERGRLALGLVMVGKVIKEDYWTEKLSETLLLNLKKFLRKNKVKLSDLEQIRVNPGPGGFSSTRTGVVTANAIALALGISVAEWPSGAPKDMVLPKYDRLPNITKPKHEPH
ncbi:MAG: hypothetical protein U1C57_03645 [Candidatus Doudnabacteria bacterium]|nr:hypothetical protein [bacterium]MDZ4244171.1 hypothetical protein [Candidatus Doudnabacteria bacterium]